MSDNPRDPNQPQAGAPEAWPPPQPGYSPPLQPGYSPPPQQPAYPPPPGYPGDYAQAPGYFPQPGYPGAYPPGTVMVPPTLVTGVEYGGFWIRMAANYLDLAALYGLTILCAITIIGILAIPFLWLGYFPYFWSRGQTPGQRVCGLRLVGELDGMPIDTGKAIVRFLAVIAECIGCIFLIGILGFIWPAFDARKRAWHDMAAGTVLIHAQLYNR